MRLQQSLAGSWRFQLDPEGSVRVGNLAPDRTIQVPLPWQAAFPELERYSGYAWYLRTIDLDDRWLAGDVLLTFGAVDYWCEVYVNGQRVGEHEGGYTAFKFAIGAFLHPGENQIAVRVYDAAYPGIKVPRWYDETDASANPPFDPTHVPHGKQSWYLEVGGIWQEVTLTAVPTAYIEQVRITPNIHTGVASIRVTLAGDLESAAGTLHVAIEDAGAETSLVAGQQDYDLHMQVASPSLWTPETPVLYTAGIALSCAAGEDNQTVRFGFREIAVRNGKLLLNDKPIFLLAALDQDMYPNTIYTVPSEAFLRDEFRKAKELGLNCLRTHIKPPDPLYLDLADEIGLLIWAEIPSWRTFYVKTELQFSRFNVTDDIKARARQTLQGMIARDFNHPALVVWSIVNEDWGTTVQLSEGDRAWLAEMYDFCKQLDPTRLVVDNSACLTNVHVKSDLDDYHIYTNIPDAADFFERFLTAFSQRANWSYSGFGDAQRTGQEALILSEFGNWGLPSIEVLREADGSLPDWFKLGPWWSGWEGEPGWPQGALERFEHYGLNAIWKDYTTFAQATQWHQYNAMKYELEVMRRQPALAGYVITELSDIYWESNGLLDFNRGTKAYHDVFGSVNAPDVVIPRLPRYATWDDQPLPMQVLGAHYSAADWTSEATLALTLNGERNERAITGLARGAVADWGIQELRFAATETSGLQRVSLRVTHAGDVLAQNQADILVLPASVRQPAFGGQLAVVADQDPLLGDFGLPLSGTLQKLGYAVTRDATADTLLVSDMPSDDVLRLVHNGAKLLYLSTGITPFFWQHGRGGVYSGNWMSCFSWLRPEVFRRLGVSNPISLPFIGVTPVGVFTGLPFEDKAVQNDILGGQVTGWVGHPAAHVVQFRCGKGIVLMTTYALGAALSQEQPHPVAVAMLHDLVDHLASDACQPTLTANI